MTFYRLIFLLVIYFAGQAPAAGQETVDDNVTPIVIIGASYAASWPIDSIAGHSVINVGIDGNQSFEMFDRFEQDVLSHEPLKVLIWGFINNLFRTEASKMEEAKMRIQHDYTEMVQAAESHGIDVVLATEVVLREPSGFKNWAAGILGRLLGKTSYQAMINEHVRETNRWLRSYAATKSIPLLDMEKLLSGADGERMARFATSDGSHLTGAAYQAITNYVEYELNANRPAN